MWGRASDFLIDFVCTKLRFLGYHGNVLSIQMILGDGDATPNILLQVMPVLVSFLQQSIQPHVRIAVSCISMFVNSLYIDTILLQRIPCSAFFSELELLSLVSDVITTFDQTPEAPPPD